MALLTAAQIRQHLETDLGDTALDRIIDAADAEIVARYGAHTGNVTEHHTPSTTDRYVFVSRTIDTVATITETFPGPLGETTEVLAPADFAVEGRRQLRRVLGGPSGRVGWAPIVEVEYLPVSDTGERTRVLIDLVKLTLAYEAVSASKVGDVSTNHVDYSRERERILRILAPPQVGFFA